MGLNGNFAMVKSVSNFYGVKKRSQIFMIEYFSTILQHERQTGFLVPEDSSILVSAANSRKFVKGKSSFNPKICTLYGLPDYSIEICYKKHCFPPGFKFFYATTINNISGDTLYVQVEDVQPQKQSISPSLSLGDFSMLMASLP
jgi:hypothetical protein